MRHWILFAYAIALGLETGAGLFTSVVVFPVWTASPEIVISWKPTLPYFMQEGDFFMISSPTTMLLALVVVILHTRRPADTRPSAGVRPWALGSGVIFLLAAVWTIAYFIPVQGRMHGDAGARLPRAELAEMLQRFVALNWIRQALLVIALVAAVHALGLSYRSAHRSTR